MRPFAGFDGLALVFAFVLLAAHPSLSVFLDEAYQVDYHHALLGLPRPADTFFHTPYADSKASLLYSLSEKNVLGAVNPKDGSLVWRHQLLPNTNGKAADHEQRVPAFLKFGDGQDRLFTAYGSVVSAWSSSDGKSIWRDINEAGTATALGLVPAPLNSAGDSHADSDPIVAFHDSHSIVQRLDSETGARKWSYQLKSDESIARIAVSSKAVYLVSLQSTLLKGLKCSITLLDINTGAETSHYTLDSDSEIKTESDILYLGSEAEQPFVVWADPSRQKIKAHILGSKSSSVLDIKGPGADISSATIHTAAQSGTSQAFLVHFKAKDQHWAVVYSLDLAKSSLSQVYELPKTAGLGAFSATSQPGGVFFTHITTNAVSLYSAVAAKSVSTWPIVSFEIPGLVEVPHPIHVSSEVVERSDRPSVYAVRSAVLLSSGDWILVRNGEINWIRHESLAGIVAASWAEVQEKDDLLEQLVEEDEINFVQAYIHRTRRHIQDLGTFVEWLKQVPTLLQGSLLKLAPGQQDETAKEKAFGFRKLIIAATENGRLVALEAGRQGRVLWNLDINEAQEPQKKWTAASIGALGSKHAIGGQVLAPADLSKTPKWQALISYLEPRNSQYNARLSAESTFASADPASDSRRLYKIKDGILEGYTKNQVYWDFRPAKGEEIVSVVSSQPDEVVASIGKALGDRRVLYKYLNANAIVVTAVEQAARRASFYLLDAVSGQLLHSSRYRNVDTSRPLSALISENWYAYSFTVDSLGGAVSKGYQLVMTELYESESANERGLLGSTGNYSTTRPGRAGLTPHVVSQVFHIPEEISSLAVTQTAQGITSRQLLASLTGTSSIVAIPRQAVDPRRTVGRDPVRSEMEEGLSRYEPMIDFDPKWYLNHREEILGVEKMMTTPAALESTSLVFAYGLDVFGTRVAPSFAFDILGSSFNKAQLTLIVAILTLGGYLAAPWIQRKQTNALWQT